MPTVSFVQPIWKDVHVNPNKVVLFRGKNIKSTCQTAIKWMHILNPQGTAHCLLLCCCCGLYILQEVDPVLQLGGLSHDARCHLRAAILKTAPCTYLKNLPSSFLCRQTTCRPPSCFKRKMINLNLIVLTLTKDLARKSLQSWLSSVTVRCLESTLVLVASSFLGYWFYVPYKTSPWNWSSPVDCGGACWD